MDVASLADLLNETAEQHGSFEAGANRPRAPGEPPSPFSHALSRTSRPGIHKPASGGSSDAPSSRLAAFARWPSLSG